MKYLGYELRMAAGRYDVYSPEGERIGAFNDVTSARRWVRIHRKAGAIARAVPSPSGKERQ